MEGSHREPQARAHQQARHYVDAARSAGRSDEEIKAALMAEGWSQHQISMLWRSLGGADDIALRRRTGAKVRPQRIGWSGGAAAAAHHPWAQADTAPHKRGHCPCCENPIPLDTRRITCDLCGLNLMPILSGRVRIENAAADDKQRMVCSQCGSQVTDYESALCSRCGYDFLVGALPDSPSASAASPADDAHAHSAGRPFRHAESGSSQTRDRVSSAGTAGARGSGAWLSEAWSLVTSDLWVHVLIALLFLLASALTVGILAVPILCGWTKMFLLKLRKSSYVPCVADVWQGFDFFGVGLLAALLWVGGYLVLIVAASLLGSVATVLGGYFVGFLLGCLYNAFTLVLFPLVVDSRLGAWEAWCASWRIAHNATGPVFGLAVLVALISNVSVLLCFVPYVLALALQTAAAAVAYLDLVAQRTEASAPLSG